jgi:hypothetical protein
MKAENTMYPCSDAVAFFHGPEYHSTMKILQAYKKLLPVCWKPCVGIGKEKYKKSILMDPNNGRR